MVKAEHDAIVATSFVCGAQAQTAEESVVFILQGTESNSPGLNRNVYKQDGNRFSYTYMNTNQVEKTRIVEVSRVEDCVFDIRFWEEPFGIDITTRYNFKLISGIEKAPDSDDGKITYKIMGAPERVCIQHKSSQTCRDDAETAPFSPDKAIRVEKAYAYFTSKYCKPAAF